MLIALIFTQICYKLIFVWILLCLYGKTIQHILENSRLESWKHRWKNYPKN